MVRVYISIGSNQNRERNIAHTLDRLQGLFGSIQCSPVYRSAAVDGTGADYYNLAVGFDTALPLTELRHLMRAIEAELDRDRGQSHVVSIDLDVLLYGELGGDFADCCLPHPDIFSYPHVLKPLADIAGDVVPPGSEKTIGELLEALAPQSDAAQRVGEH